MMVFTGPLSAAPLISAQTVASSNNTGSSSSSSTMENMVLNLGTPIFIEHDRTTSMTNITQNISNSTFVGNGTFMLPPTTGLPPTGGGNVSVTFSGYRVANTTGGLVRAEGQVFIKTIDGKESATFPFARFTPINSTIGIGIAYFRTNSTTIATMGQQQLASLNNTLMVYRDEAISPTQHSGIFWKWNPVASSSSQAAVSLSENLSSLPSSGGNISSPETMVLNLGTPLLIDHARATSITNITQNVIRTTFEGNNGTIMLPTGRNVSTISSGDSITNTTGGMVKRSGQVVFKTMDGNESAVLTFKEFQPVNSTMGIGIGYIQTNSTMEQQLGPLNNTSGVYKSEHNLSPALDTVTFWHNLSPALDTVTFWKWK